MALSRTTPDGWLEETGSLSRVTPFGWVQESQSVASSGFSLGATSASAFSGSAQGENLFGFAVATASTYSGSYSAGTGFFFTSTSGTNFGGSFETTASGQGTITSGVLKNNTRTVLANETGIIVNVYDITTGELVVRKTNVSTNASGIFTISDALIEPGTTYAYEPILTGSRRRLPTGVAS